MKLQILIVAYGLDDGILNIINHPAIENVEYIVSWQNADLERLPPDFKNRPDIKIFPTDTIGISNNRNEAFRHATADFVILSDADLKYTEENLQTVLRAFEENPDKDIISFRYFSSRNPKSYPEKSFSLNGKLPKGYSVASVELGFNLKRIRESRGGLGDLRFNPNFGINGRITQFICGEEEILLVDLLKKGYQGIYMPCYICEHPEATTADRMEGNPDFIATKGAFILKYKPVTWPLRMLSHAWRAHRGREENHIDFPDYCRYWLRGVKLARRERVFKHD